MVAQKTAAPDFKVGTYICPHTKKELPLLAACALPFLEWPVIVDPCPDCGQKHVLRSEDVRHPPAFGYE